MKLCSVVFHRVIDPSLFYLFLMCLMVGQVFPQFFKISWLWRGSHVDEIFFSYCQSLSSTCQFLPFQISLGF